MKSLIDKAIHGDMDSDRHLISIFAMALASRGKIFVELGVREGHTTEPLYEAAKLVGAHLWSVDLNDPTKYNLTMETILLQNKTASSFLRNGLRIRRLMLHL